MRLFYPVVGYSSFTEHPHGDMEEGSDGLYVLHSEAQAEIERLRLLVREAFTEAWRNALTNPVIGWEHSDAKKQLRDKP